MRLCDLTVTGTEIKGRLHVGRRQADFLVEAGFLRTDHRLRILRSSFEKFMTADLIEPAEQTHLRAES